ncbi:hypothetical protein [Enemella sp. A6]|uniref:hypothetical protein n=1 Tax=Enemella sp. A6 TaxID=3440152 RepID=UPI003EBBDF9B
MATTTTHSKQRARRKLREVLIGLTLMILITGAALWFVLSKAGEWGVPGFTYTNEYGSTCENGFVTNTCTELTREELGARLEVPFPEQTEVLESTLEEGSNTTLRAKIRFPQADAGKFQAALAEKYGHCRNDLPPPAMAEGMQKPCVMGNDRFASESMSIRYVLVLGVREGEQDPVLGMDFLWR